MLRVSIIAIIFLLYIVFTLSVGPAKYLPHINYSDFLFISKCLKLAFIGRIPRFLRPDGSHHESGLPRG